MTRYGMMDEAIRGMAVRLVGRYGHDRSDLELLIKVDCLKSTEETSRIQYAGVDISDETIDYENNRAWQPVTAVICFKEPFCTEEELKLFLQEYEFPTDLSYSGERNAYVINGVKVSVFLYGCYEIRTELPSTQHRGSESPRRYSSPKAPANVVDDDDVPF